MSYSTTSSQIASVQRAQLAQLITDARRTTTETERPLVELAGQAAACVLDGVDDDALVDLQIHGSDLPSQDARVWFLSITTKRIKAPPATAVDNTPWDRSKGPMALKEPVPPPSNEVASPGDTAGT